MTNFPALYKQALASDIKVEVPTVSEILLAINQELNSESPDIDKIGQLISRDMALSKSLLWLVNSPLYGLPRRITDIQLALSLIGIKKIKTAVLMPALNSSLSIKPGVPEMVWKTSILKAMSASKLAGFLDTIDADNAYMSGLFSGSGQLVLSQNESDYESLLQQSYDTETLINELEIEKYGVSSALISFKIAELWKLPVPIRVAILFQNIDDYPSLKDGRVRELIAVLIVAEACLDGLLNDDVVCSLLLPDWKEFRLNQALIELALSHDYFEEIKMDIQDELLKCLDEVMGF